MKKCIIIGGGFAGLSSAVFLSQAGFKVELIEASQKLGGRAYSFKDKDTQTVIDNGQHILMGCYKNTFKFLKLIGAENNLNFQRSLKVNFLKKNFELNCLEASTLPYPFNLISALMNYKVLSFNERLNLLKFFLKIYFYSEAALNKMTVYEWLQKEGQNENVRKAFWEFLAVGALNTNTKKASAKVFSDILKQIFFRGNKAATIILPKDGLTETYCINSADYIINKKGEINFSEQVLDLRFAGEKLISIKTTKRVLYDYDYVISAIPLYSLEKILPLNRIGLYLPLAYSAILSIHIWLKENKLKNTFYGLICSPVHWVFNHGTHLTLVISDANDLVEKSNEELFEMAAAELEKFVKIDIDSICSFKIIKEKRSTFIPSNEIVYKRPPSRTKYNNFFLAGDWIDTGLPSTIESAVKSGRMAVEEIGRMENGKW